MSKEYDEYLREHICAVNTAAEWMTNNLSAVKDLSDEDLDDFTTNVALHDSSKRSFVEYGPYDAYFYGTPNEDEFNLAWLHHIHHNEHHWQHWLLMQDDGKYRDPSKVIALEMPKIYALEMVADWWSFSWRSGNLAEMFTWYEEHRDHIILHENTRAYVEGILEEIRECIEDDAE